MLCATAKGNNFQNQPTLKKYSNYRDLIQFSVEGNTTEYHKFKIADTYEEGDVIYAAATHMAKALYSEKDHSPLLLRTYLTGNEKHSAFSCRFPPETSWWSIASILKPVKLWVSLH